MTSRKILIDTNVFIGLEDPKEILPEFAGMLRACGQYGVHVFVHEEAVADIRRDRDIARRDISLSKINKFEFLSGIHLPPQAELEAHFGSITSPNDQVDVALLHALEIGAVDFLITQDQGIHSRSKKLRPNLADRILTVADAVLWLNATYAPKEVRLPLIREVKAHSIPVNDDIFNSLREGYPGFDKWWSEKCIPEHRLCWEVSIDNELAAILVRKEETPSEAKINSSAKRILKICTFKVKPKFRGEKLGELLLKQALWFAQKNQYDAIYLTTFPDQIFLIRVLEYFGFQKTGVNSLGEDIYEKTLSVDRLVANVDDDLFKIARLNYPRFVAQAPAQAFCVPIKSEYHDVLFPEISEHQQADLFRINGLPYFNSTLRTPGNTIRKVYLCRSKTRALTPGSILIFYRSKSPGYAISQSITSIGIVESVNETVQFDELVRLTAKRSVYSKEQLHQIHTSSNAPVKVIDFLLVGHLEPAITLQDLITSKVFNKHPPQSICHFSESQLAPIRARMNFGFSV